MNANEATKIPGLVAALNSKGGASLRLKRLVGLLRMVVKRRHKEDLVLDLMAGKTRREYRPPFRKREGNVLLFSETEKLDGLSPAGLSSIPDFKVLRLQIAKEYAALARSSLAEEATLALQLLSGGKILKLRNCGFCGSFFSGRRGKSFCGDSCRASHSKASRPAEEKMARRRRYLEDVGIPGCEKRVEKLRGDPVGNAGRIQRWKAKVKSYRDELRLLKYRGGK